MKKATIILTIIIIISSLGGGLSSIAFADTASYSDVLSDLKQDASFDVEAYPLRTNDYSLEVIQIAESKDREVLVYVYQPSGSKITATEIRLSTSIGDSYSPKDYKLALLNSNGALAKYRVVDLEVKTDAVRYYDVVQIARLWDSSIDKATGNNNTTATVPYKVGKLFTACTVSGEVTYVETHEEVITITDKWFGYIRYSNGFKLYKDSCDAWFIAFNTDMPIDQLFDADVSFMQQKFAYYKQLGGWQVNENFTDKAPTGPHAVKLTDKETATTKADGLFAYKYEWKRIESVADFKKNEDLSKDYLKNLEGKKWVLRFTETDYDEYTSAYTGTRNFTVISEVTILRLHFKSNGRVYNLGVVDNKLSNPDGPVNNDTEPIDGALKGLEKFLAKLSKFFSDVGKWFSDHKWLIVLIVVLLVLAILAPFVPIIATGFKYLFLLIWYILKYLFIGLAYVIASPVLLIRWLVRKGKDSDEEK